MTNLEDEGFFQDDFFLDEEVLATLDAVETRYALSQVPPPRIGHTTAPPPAKRVKNNGWHSGGLSKGLVIKEVDENPAVVILEDGSYGIANPVGGTHPVGTTNSVKTANVAKGLAAPPKNLSVSQVSHLQSTRNNVTTSRQISRTHSQPLHSSQPRPVSTLRVAQVASTSKASTSNSVTLNKPPLSPVRETELTSLRAELARVRIDNANFQAALHEANEVRLAKEGEAATLRRKMEKSAANHSEELAKIKAEKLAAEVKMAEVERAAAADMERLKSRILFKQHELETSTRKSKWPANQPKPIQNRAAPTPARLPFQIPGGSDNDLTSRRHINSVSPKNKPSISNAQSDADKYKEKDRVIFPSFVNSFGPSSPVKSPKKPSKGKERAIEDVFFSQPHPRDSSQPPPQDQLEVNPGPENERPTDAVATVGGDPVVEENIDIDSVEVLEVPDIAEQLQHIIFTHSTPPLYQPTLQVILSISFPASAPAYVTKLYAGACSLLLATLGTKSSFDRDEFFSAAGKPLIEIATSLITLPDLQPLISLLDLLTTLTISFPPFNRTLLSPTSDDDISPSIMLSTICDIIREHLQPIDGDLSQERQDLARSLFDIVNAMCWFVPNEHVEQLALIARRPQVLSNLLSPQHPTWIRDRTLQLLSLLATHGRLFRDFLAFPEAHLSVSHEPARDFTRIPLIDTLCKYLTEPPATSTSTQLHLAFQSIINFFSSVAMAHSDALAILVQSQALIPSLVVCLTNIVTCIWEDDEDTMQMPSIAHIIKTIEHITHLFHYLIFTPRPQPNLRYKLQQGDYQGYNGLHHMFIVTIGRMSYAEAPPWVGSQAIGALEKIVEMSRDIMETVVQGPEGDSIWATYQDYLDSDENVTQTDDEEAMRLTANDFN